MTFFRVWKNIYTFAQTQNRGLILLLAVATVLVAGGIGSSASSLLGDRLAGREWLLVIGALGGFVAVSTSIVRFDWMIFLCFATLGLVQIEPAPVDGLSMLLLGLGVISGRLPLTPLRRASVFHAALLTFLVVNFLALPGSEDLTYAIRYTVITIYLFGFAYLVKLYATSLAAMRWMLLGYLASSLFSVFLVVLGYAGIGPEETFVFESRATAFFKDSNVYAPSLVLAVVLLVDEIFRPRLIPGLTWLKIGAILALAAGVFFSFSRASLAHLLLAVGIYFLFNLHEVVQPKRLLALMGVGVAAIVAIAVAIIQLDLLEFLLWRASPVQSYDVDNRFATQAIGLVAGATHLFGIGPGMLDHAHSLYIRTFAEYGIFGFIPLLSGIAILVVQTWRAARREAHQEIDKIHGLSSQVVFASFVSMLGNGFVIDLMHWRQFWFLVGLAWLVAVLQDQTPPPGNKGA